MKKSILFLMMLIAVATVSAQDLVDRVSKAVGVELPSEYKSSVKTYVQSSKLLEGLGGDFAEQYIIQIMKEDWGINKQNQLLFIWDAIYYIDTKKDFYDGEDGNKKRLDDYEKALFNDNIDAFSKNYVKECSKYMKQKSAEARRQSAEARQRSAEQTYVTLTQLIRFYILYNNNPNTVREDELRKMKEGSEFAIKSCKEFNIDYYALLPLEVQRFYDIRPSKQNSLTCEKAIVQILNITLDEIVKLYNICQQAPHAKRDKIALKHEIECCQEYNVDYKRKLTPDIRRFYGIE